MDFAKLCSTHLCSWSGFVAWGSGCWTKWLVLWALALALRPFLLNWTDFCTRIFGSSPSSDLGSDRRPKPHKNDKKKLNPCCESYISGTAILGFWPFSESILTNFPMLQPVDFLFVDSFHHQQQNVENRLSKFDIEPIFWDLENRQNTCRKFIVIIIIFTPC